MLYTKFDYYSIWPCGPREEVKTVKNLQKDGRKTRPTCHSHDYLLEWHLFGFPVNCLRKIEASVSEWNKESLKVFLIWWNYRSFTIFGPETWYKDTMRRHMDIDERYKAVSRRMLKAGITQRHVAERLHVFESVVIFCPEFLLRPLFASPFR